MCDLALQDTVDEDQTTILASPDCPDATTSPSEDTARCHRRVVGPHFPLAVPSSPHFGWRARGVEGDASSPVVGGTSTTAGRAEAEYASRPSEASVDTRRGRSSPSGLSVLTPHIWRRRARPPLSPVSVRRRPWPCRWRPAVTEGNCKPNPVLVAAGTAPTSS